MRIAVLSTETPHHAFFVREIAAGRADVTTFDEQRRVVAPFPTAHPFEEERDRRERDAWFGGEDRRMADFSSVRRFRSMNDDDAIAALRAFRPDLTVSVGVGRLSGAFIAACPGALVNLHGGDPEDYRGLDSHLWAIYHRDFGSLVTTLHAVNETLDDGPVIAAAAVPLRRGMALADLRRANTEVAVGLTLDAVAALERDGRLFARPQRRIGRYYSFMPAELKEGCRRAFERHCEKLT
jgi:methionyl-tRNA formyltransferase